MLVHFLLIPDWADTPQPSDVYEPVEVDIREH
jgi:hypothetical protein